MNNKEINGYTRKMHAPPGWDAEKEGSCGTLAIRDMVQNDRQWMVSEWKPTPEELRKLVAGASVYLFIQGVTHPVVSLDVGSP